MEKLWAPWRLAYIKNAEKSNEECIFCSKPKQDKDKENLIAFRSKHSFVILNKFPYNNGHVMVVPYVHKPDLRDIPDEVLMDIQKTVKRCFTALEETMQPHGFNVGLNMGRTAGAGIDQHIHYHIVPRWNGDTNYMPILAGTKVISEALDETWEKINKAMNQHQNR